MRYKEARRDGDEEEEEDGEEGKKGRENNLKDQEKIANGEITIRGTYVRDPGKVQTVYPYFDLFSSCKTSLPNGLSRQKQDCIIEQSQPTDTVR